MSCETGDSQGYGQRRARLFVPALGLMDRIRRKILFLTFRMLA